jgi:hypothetical protein
VAERAAEHRNLSDSEGDALALLRALADPTRLTVFAAVLLGSGTTAAVAATTGARERDVIAALSRLEAAGLLRRGAAGWSATPERLQAAAAAAAAAAERSVIDHGAEDPSEASVLRTFMPQGRLLQMPAQESKRRVVLDHMCRVFEPGSRYPESEVNTVLRAFTDDYVTVRRYLVDYGLLARSGGEYWRIGGPVDV